MKAYYKKYDLLFKQPAGTSRGVLKKRPVWLLLIEKNGITGIGECAPLPGLSKETPADVEKLLVKLCSNPAAFQQNIDLLAKFPSVKLALETALLDLKNGGKKLIFPSAFSAGKAGIKINGLIWMGEIAHMQQQIHEKLQAGFSCIKLKIGAKSFKEELSLLAAIRKQFSSDKIMLRVDANGAFKTGEASDKLQELAEFDIHSIEQPIAAAQWKEMARLCQTTPLPIALDEELIGINTPDDKKRLLDTIQPQFLVLKPSLHGGISGCNEWIELANERAIGWWITSYLESNIGLNAIAQWAFTKQPALHQGLGTGQLFTNNFASPLEIRGEKLWYNPSKYFEI
ncbi:o-succinylbenzoate synthase [uncultured Draconibacterium sp.]|uniref:o-succinylbenzoate synthase n=1 Tax=uncultured Draconibacterium sp. TaxID=1573823 RepID=UPI0032612E9B